ncbi:hypothetical protein P9273_03510 [Mesorhizobium sp. WSM4935]|uniref:hypothetical protein n=1 Tax=Mesorhizobium sp. WSM4935 TaxID=3038547 RepID=UPI002414F67E|nr:hypothetical protein [Mesorhizobium sp. WSM4935]MDG4874165.1 hypothetical protein [Mesorhizobium sp. WSM4935]
MTQTVTEQALPYWIRLIQALGPTFAGFATAAIALAVAVIAYRQWRTAHDKILLDLFDRRFSVFNETAEFYKFCFSHTWHDIELHQLQPFHEVRRRAQFLFPKSVQDYLKDLHETAIDGHQAAGSASGKWGEQDEAVRHEARKVVLAKVEHLRKLGEEMGMIFAPFMAMHQRAQ